MEMVPLTAIDKADTGWVMVASALVLLMTLPGIALFYAGLVRRKNVVNTMVAVFAVACVVAIITMHDAMGVRHETGEQAKVLNQMIDQWIEVSEKNAPFLQNMHLKEMVGHTPLQVLAGFVVGCMVGLLYPMV